MLTSFNQNWRTTHLPFSLALANTVTTGVSFDTPSGATRNSQIWGRAGFRGLGPVLSFPGGSGMDGMRGCHCGGSDSGSYGFANWAYGGGMGQLDTSAITAPVQNITSAFGGFGFAEWLIIGAVAYMVFSAFLTTKRAVSEVRKYRITKKA